MSAEEDYKLFGQVAEMLSLDDEEGKNFIQSAMTRRGHKAITSWADGDDSSSGDGGDFFSSKRKSREQRPVNRGGADWQYRTGS